MRCPVCEEVATQVIDGRPICVNQNCESGKVLAQVMARSSVLKPKAVIVSTPGNNDSEIFKRFTDTK